MFLSTASDSSSVGLSFPGREENWVPFESGPVWFSSEYQTRDSQSLSRSETQNRFLEAGTPVVYSGTGVDEHGVVVHCWTDDETNLYDCYVAFFGIAVPEGKPERKPYVLRYFASSLRVVDEEGLDE